MILKPVFVITQLSEQLRIRLKFRSESVEVWLKEDTDYRDHHVCRTLVAKLECEIDLSFNEFERVIYASGQIPADSESLQDYILDTGLQQIKRTIDEEIEVSVKASNIRIGQTIAKSWVDMTDILLTPLLVNPETKFLQHDILEPTQITVKLLTKEQFKLEDVAQIELSMQPLVLKLDYKDVDLLYTIAKKAEKILDNIQQKNLFENFSKRMTKKVGMAIN